MIQNLKSNQEGSSPIVSSAMSTTTQGILGAHPSTEKFLNTSPHYNFPHNPLVIGQIQPKRTSDNGS